MTVSIINSWYLPEYAGFMVMIVCLDRTDLDLHSYNFMQELNGEIARLTVKTDTHTELRDSYRDEIRRYQNANRVLQWRVYDLERENRTLRTYADLVLGL